MAGSGAPTPEEDFRRRRAPGRASTRSWSSVLVGRDRCSSGCSRGRSRERPRLGGARADHRRHRRLRLVAEPPGPHDRLLPAGRRGPALVDHRPLGHRHPGERHHLPVASRPGLRGRPGVRAVLLRAAHRDGDPVGDLPAHLPPPRTSTRPTSTWSSASTGGRGSSWRSSSSSPADSPRGSPSTRRRWSSRRCWAGRPCGRTSSSAGSPSSTRWPAAAGRSAGPSRRRWR